MKSVNVAKLKASLSEYLAAVKRGEEVMVTERGRPIARILPLPHIENEELRERLYRLAAEGRIKLPERWPTKESIKEFLSRPKPADPEGLVLKALLEEREEGR